MNPEEWIELVFANVKIFGDEEFQRRVWIRGEGPEVSDLGEAYLGFSDLETGLLIEKWQDWHLPQSPRHRLKEFLDALLSFYQRQPKGTRQEEILSDPEWPSLVQLARAAWDSYQSEFGRADS